MKALKVRILLGRFCNIGKLIFERGYWLLPIYEPFIPSAAALLSSRASEVR